MGKTVFEGYLEVTPLGKAEAIIKYALPGNIDSKNYKILVQKQPGTYADKLKVEIDGRGYFNGALDVDKEIKTR